MEQEEKELKKCPFCGHAAQYKKEPNWVDDIRTGGKTIDGYFYKVQCKCCSISTLAYPTKHLAQDVWNTRKGS